MKSGNSLVNDFFEKGRVADCPVFDMHGHMGTYSRIFFPMGAATPKKCEKIRYGRH